jgi:hypothetical protein
VRHLNSRPRRSGSALVVGAALTLVACGGGDDDGGGTDAFCAALETFVAANDEATFVEDFRAVAEAAPDEIADATDELLAGFEVLGPLTEAPESEEERLELLELIASLEEPQAELEEFARANCPDDVSGSMFGG